MEPNELLNKIERCRGELKMLAASYGLSHCLVVMKSIELDELIVQFMKMKKPIAGTIGFEASKSGTISRLSIISNGE